MSIARSVLAPEGGALRVSVIVPHYNQPALLARCLASLHAQTLDPAAFEIIVCDNQSPGGVSDIAARYPNVRFITEPARGAACARNAAMQIATGSAIAFIDADCIAHRGWLETGLTALEGGDLVGGDVVIFCGDAKRPTAVEAFELIFAFHQRIYINRKHFSVTANLFASREAAMAIGPFKDGVAEDFEWCRRARALGFRLAFNRTSIVSHPARRDWGELTQKWERLTLERWNGIGGRSLIRRVAWAGLAIITALSAVPHLAKVVFSTRINRTRDRFAAAAVLTRIRIWRARRMLALL